MIVVNYSPIAFISMILISINNTFVSDVIY